MFNKIKELLWNTFSETDQNYLDLVRIGYALTLLFALGLQVYSIYKNQNFSMVDFGTGISLILFGGGAGIGIRGRLEDGKSNDKPNNKK